MLTLVRRAQVLAMGPISGLGSNVTAGMSLRRWVSRRVSSRSASAARAKPSVHALTAEAERLLTLRETHRLNDIPAVTFEPSALMAPITKA